MATSRSGLVKLTLITLEPDCTEARRLAWKRSTALSITSLSELNRRVMAASRPGGNSRSAPISTTVARATSALSMICTSDSTCFRPSMLSTAGPVSVTFWALDTSRLTITMSRLEAVYSVRLVAATASATTSGISPASSTMRMW